MICVVIGLGILAIFVIATLAYAAAWAIEACRIIDDAD